MLGRILGLFRRSRQVEERPPAAVLEIEGLRNDIAGLRSTMISTVEDLERRIGLLEERVSSLESAVSSITSLVTGLSSAIDRVERGIEGLAKAVEVLMEMGREVMERVERGKEMGRPAIRGRYRIVYTELVIEGGRPVREVFGSDKAIVDGITVVQMPDGRARVIYRPWSSIDSVRRVLRELGGRVAGPARVIIEVGA